jgi:hypothetical protein
VRPPFPYLVYLMLLLLSCAAEPRTSTTRETTSAPRADSLLPVRVDFSVKRQARGLLYVETERERLITTPEHPFATPRSGWMAASELSSGDLVISARFGAVRVSSLRRETPLRPVPCW